jgi:DNA ligase-1
MKFSQLAKYLQKLEDTPKRLEITAILAELIEKLKKNEVDKGLYLSLGYLKAEFESEKFNIAEKMMAKVLAQAYDATEQEVKKKFSSLGDLGNVAEKLANKNSKFDLNINETHEKLMEIAQVEGAGSQERKISLSAELLNQANPLSAKYLVRIILGTTRLGFTELTVVDALVQTVTGEKDKEVKKEIEDKYRIHPDIGLITKKIKGKGLAGLKDVGMEVGTPVHAQKAQRLSGPSEIIEKMGEVWMEYKFDGTRVQLHMDKDKTMEIEAFEQQEMFEVKKEMTFIKTFTRNLEETTHQFPDIIGAANKRIDAKSVILDGEAVGYNKKTGKFLPFQETIQRKRKHGVSAAAKKIPLKYMVFDILFLNGKSLVDEPLTKRRKLLDSIIKADKIIQIDKYVQTGDAAKVAKFHKEALDKGLEGIMVKRVSSPYQAGARNFAWVKLKKLEEQILSDTVDCVVLGYYHGRGARAKFGIGGFLVAIWDEKDNKYKTLTKVGSGLKDNDWAKLKEIADKIAVKGPPKNADINKKYNCDVWIKPEIVVEIAADEVSKSSDHSVGYALRFPRLIKFRKDRKPKDTTTPKEIEHMYEIQ